METVQRNSGHEVNKDSFGTGLTVPILELWPLDFFPLFPLVDSRIKEKISKREPGSLSSVKETINKKKIRNPTRTLVKVEEKRSIIKEIKKGVKLRTISTDMELILFMLEES